MCDSEMGRTKSQEDVPTVGGRRGDRGGDSLNDSRSDASRRALRIIY
jgi:hypothetical protein